MKNSDWDKIWIGFLLGLIAPFIAFLAYYLINFHYLSFRRFINYLLLGDYLFTLCKLCVLANLLPFYLFINKEKYKATKGIIGATLFCTAIILVYNFFA